MGKREKSFNLKLYAVIAFFAVAAALSLMVVFTFKSKYTAFHPEEVARNYADTIVQTGDGYNAYKTALVSKSSKYGDYIRKYYMYPVIYREANYTPDADIATLKGFNDKSYMSEKTEKDDGSLQGQVIEKMYPYYVQLTENGWDNYGEIFTKYFEELVRIRKEVFGDDYMTDEIMFTALESNVASYGKTLTGTEDEFDKNTKKQISFKSIGAYEKAYGEDYKFTTVVTGDNPLDLNTYKSNIDENKFAEYGVKASDISDVKCYTIAVKTADGKQVSSIDVVVAKVGSSWYVDSTATDTSPLYSFYK